VYKGPIFLEIRRLGSEVEYSLRTSAEVKKTRTHSPIRLVGVRLN
jgi:hypothetical protein